MIQLKDGSKRLLRAEEIEVKIGNYNKAKTRFTVLLYKTARTDMAILDEVFGSANWQTHHYEVKGKDFCSIKVKFSDEWVEKSDCGDETDYEAKKGESSDAMKRAGFQWGIGRELYSAPQIWFDVDVDLDIYSLKVSTIAYNELDRISDLEIVGKIKGDKQARIVYQFGAGKSWTISKNDINAQKQPKADVKPQPDHDTLEKIRDIVEKLEFEGENIDEILAYYHVKTIGEIPLEKWEKMLAKVRGA